MALGMWVPLTERHGHLPTHEDAAADVGRHTHVQVHSATTNSHAHYPDAYHRHPH